MLADAFVGEHGGNFQLSSFKAELARLPNLDCCVIKPQTYMNRSGEAVQAVLDYYRVPLSSLLVVYDDLDLALGGMKFSRSGSSGGHRGMESIIQACGEQAIHRLKLGIGRPEPDQDPADYVLKRFMREEKVLVDEVLEKGKKALRSYLDVGLEAAMNQYNG